MTNDTVTAKPTASLLNGGTGEEKSCWVTQITTPSYLPGAIVLAHTLDKHQSARPLLVQYTASLGEGAIKVLQAESKRGGRILTQEVELLLPRAGQENQGSVAERFQDTFTKLRAFEIYKLGYTKCCFLDADMAVFRNPDFVFETKLPDKDWLAANHACVCNLDRDLWADTDWHKGNCAYTPLENPDGVAPKITSDCRPTYHALNSGMFLYCPSEELWTNILDIFNTSDKLKDYQFPDQDFLVDFFHLKWQPVSWRFNALKTMRYWHPNMWSDDLVTVLHYIVDKPWERQVSADGAAGHLGRDGVTHRWWWDLYNEWHEDAGASTQGQEVVEVIEKLVNTQEPFTKKVPIAQSPGKPEDVKPWP